MMTVEQMVAEMTRKPDAHLLAKWTADVIANYPQSQPGRALTDIERVSDAYFQSMEG